MHKIVITGPESTGKSTLTKLLSEYYDVPFVSEYARAYISNLDKIYTYEDVLRISVGQLLLEEEIKKERPNFLLCDTDLLTIKIWIEDKFGRCPNSIKQNLDDNRADLYLLCDIDLPWEYDEQREDENRRKTIYNNYLEELKSMNANFSIVSGIGDNRLECAKKIIDNYLQS